MWQIVKVRSLRPDTLIRPFCSYRTTFRVLSTKAKRQDKQAAAKGESDRRGSSLCKRWFMARETDVEGHYVQEFATISSRDFRTQAGLTGRRGPKRSQLSCAFVVNWEAREFTNTLAILNND